MTKIYLTLKQLKQGVEIRIQGLGNIATPNAPVLYLEKHKLYVNADFANGDFTHAIDLDGAAERLPNLQEVRAALIDRKRHIDGGTDVRLQILDDGNWSLHTGDNRYDQDHRGSWGCGTLTNTTNCTNLARDPSTRPRSKWHVGDRGTRPPASSSSPSLFLLNRLAPHARPVCDRTRTPTNRFSPKRTRKLRCLTHNHNPEGWPGPLSRRVSSCCENQL